MTGSIQEIYTKIKSILMEDTVFYSLLILLVGVASFGLGRWSASESAEINQQSAVQFIQNNKAQAVGIKQDTSEVGDSDATTQGAYVASKNASKYHFPWCPGAKQMKEENKIWFASKEEAERAGYAPAANCNGL